MYVRIIIVNIHLPQHFIFPLQHVYNTHYLKSGSFHLHINSILCHIGDYCWSLMLMVSVEHYYSGFTPSLLLEDRRRDATQLGHMYHPVFHRVPYWDLSFLFCTRMTFPLLWRVIKMFADDVALYTKVASFSDCEALQSDMDSIIAWCYLWQMKSNPLKCELLCISNKWVPSMQVPKNLNSNNE